MRLGRKFPPPALAALGLLALAGCASQTAARPEPRPGQPWAASLPGNTTLELAWIPPGRFLLGSPPAEPGRRADEGPQTETTISQGFWLGKTMVTVGQWKSLMGAGVREQLARQINDDTLYDLGGRKQTLREFMHWSREADPSIYLGNEDDNLPMYFVSWNDAMAFCAKLTECERAAGRLPANLIYTLPTEAQWEYAARAGTIGATYAGPANAETLGKIAWYNANSAAGYTGRAVRNGQGPRAVAQKEPNAWGLYDMYGNIWQWCRDWYGPYPGGSVTDPVGPAAGPGRVNRGGSFGSGPNDERSARRAFNPQAEASAYRGFRVALCAVP